MAKKKLYPAFTLAEVLITLAIIGVVAAMTLPVLINNINDMQYKSAYKKAFSVAGQAFIAMDKDNLVGINSDYAYDPVYFQKFMTNFKIAKSCTSGSNNSDCWDNTGELFGLDFSSGYPTNNCYAFIDTSGMAWTVINGTEGRIGVDVNAFKPPNIYGQDRFILRFQDINGLKVDIPAKIVPWGDCTNTDTTSCANVCPSNKCGTAGSSVYRKYYGKSWLYN